MSVRIDTATLDAELLKEFFVGCEEHLSESENAFIDLEKHPQDMGLINDIFRHFHSVKGDAAALGFDAVRILAHELETILDKLREHTLSVAPTLLDLLLEGLSLLRAQVKAIQDNANLPDTSGIIVRLKTYNPEEETYTGTEEKEGMYNVSTAELTLAESGAALLNEEKTYTVFRTGKLWCALDVTQSNEIIAPPHITRVPNVEKFIEGVINLRGSIVPIIHLGRRLGIDADLGADAKILLLIIDEMRLGLLVSEVAGVRTWTKSRVLKPESVSFDLKKTFVTGVVTEMSRIVLLLNVLEIIRRNGNLKQQNKQGAL